MAIVTAKYPNELITMTADFGNVSNFVKLVDGEHEITSQHHNQAYAEITAIETELGINIKGSKTDLKTRLDVSLNDNGIIVTIQEATFNGGIKNTTGSVFTMKSDAGIYLHPDYDTNPDTYLSIIYYGTSFTNGVKLSSGDIQICSDTGISLETDGNYPMYFKSGGTGGIYIYPDIVNASSLKMTFLKDTGDDLKMTVGSNYGVVWRIDDGLTIYPDYDGHSDFYLSFASYIGTAASGVAISSNNIQINSDGEIRLESGGNYPITLVSEGKILFYPNVDFDSTMYLLIENDSSEIKLKGSAGDSIGIESLDEIQLRAYDGLKIYPDYDGNSTDYLEVSRLSENIQIKTANDVTGGLILGPQYSGGSTKIVVGNDTIMYVNSSGIYCVEPLNVSTIKAEDGMTLYPDFDNIPTAYLSLIGFVTSFTTGVEITSGDIQINSDTGIILETDGNYPMRLKSGGTGGIYLYPDNTNDPAMILKVAKNVDEIKIYGSSGDSIGIESDTTIQLKINNLVKMVISSTKIQCEAPVMLEALHADVGLDIYPAIDEDVTMFLSIEKNSNEIKIFGSTGDSIGIESLDEIQLRAYDGLKIYPDYDGDSTMSLTVTKSVDIIVLQGSSGDSVRISSYGTLSFYAGDGSSTDVRMRISDDHIDCQIQLCPKSYTTVEIDIIPTSWNGGIVYDSDLGVLKYYDGVNSLWKTLATV